MVRDNKTDNEVIRGGLQREYPFGLVYARRANERTETPAAEPARLWFRSREDRAEFIRIFSEVGYTYFHEVGVSDDSNIRG